MLLLQRRLGWVLAAILLTTLSIAGIGIQRISDLRASLKAVATSEIDRQVLIEQWSFQTRLNLLRTKAALRSTDPAFAALLKRESVEASAQIDLIGQRIDPLITEPEGRRQLALIDDVRAVYIACRARLEMLKAAGVDVQEKVELELGPLARLYGQRQENLNAYFDSQLRGRQNEHLALALAAQWALGMGALLAMLMSAVLAVLWSRSAAKQRCAEQRMLHSARHDALTGLPNRSVLAESLEQAIAQARRDGQQAAVGFIDLDGFKEVNDNLGHAAGDLLLQQTAERIVRCTRRGDTVVRLGGDEFVVIFTGIQGGAQALEPYLQRIVTQVGEVTSIGAEQIKVTCSMGVATYPTDGEDIDTLLRRADSAMYQAKERGANHFQHYRRDDTSTSAHRLRLHAALGTSLARKELSLRYQPQLSLRTGKLTGVEALLRWQHPELGDVSPARFIPVAERTGLILPIGAWVLHTACARNQAWQAAGLPPVSIAVNVSARQFREPNFAAQVERVLRETGLAPRFLELELTESMLMHDVSAAVATMREITALGVALSIDDFGTGYSSLAVLKTFPLTRLKVDQSFLRNIDSDEEGQAIAGAVISLGHKLKLGVIAEGIETQAQLDFIRSQGCDEMQGYLFSPPLDAAAVADLLDAQRAGSRWSANTEIEIEAHSVH